MQVVLVAENVERLLTIAAQDIHRVLNNSVIRYRY